MIISLIAAMGKNRVIGKNNSLPWKLPADMEYFKKLTKGKPVIMGRKTFESMGKALPNRINIIITSNKNYKAKDCVIVHSIKEALKSAGNKNNEEAMVIGGAKIYEEFLPIANKVYLTVIDEDFDGNIYFPDFSRKEWKETKREEHESDKVNPYKYAFLVFERN
ncbi:type 3 dihydrofolate reductase [Candidatus Woesearchaeota archaeon]|nr:type 3 dihydrofolate reductase [Candidatus Woesearchaeota archaeon]